MRRSFNDAISAGERRVDAVDAARRITDMRQSLPRVIRRSFDYQREPTFENQQTGRDCSSLSNIVAALGYGHFPGWRRFADSVLSAAGKHGMRRHDFNSRHAYEGGTVCIDLEFIEAALIAVNPIKARQKINAFKERNNVR
jgi:hypothetical protein